MLQCVTLNYDFKFSETTYNMTKQNVVVYTPTNYNDIKDFYSHESTYYTYESYLE